MDSFHTEPARGVIGDIGALNLPGSEVGRMMAHGELAAPPIHHLTGIRPTASGLGSMTWEMPVTEWLQDRYGVIWGGVYAFFSDAVVGTALQTGLPPGKLATTSELTMSYVRPATLDSGRFLGHGQTIHLGRHVGLSDTRIEDRHGRLLAYASTRCVIIDVPVPEETPLISEPDPSTDSPDPYLRKVPEHIRADWRELRELTPRESFAKQWESNEIDVGLVAHMTGHRGVEMGDGTYTLEWPASPWFSAGAPTMYGGAIAWALDTAIEGAIYSTLEPGEFNAALDLHVRFLRPAALDAGTLTVRGEVQHRGHRMRVATAEMADSEGRRLAFATGSALLVPDGVDHLLGGGATDDMATRPATGS